LASHLRQITGVHHVAVAGDGEQGLDWLQHQGVDVVVLDLVLPGIGGLATCRQITATHPAPVLILTSHDDTRWLQQIWQAGARGYLHKERAFAQVELALRSLLLGASWWDQKATAALQRLELDASVSNAAAESGARLSSLTQREHEVLACLADGDNNRTIAQRLGIGEGTVRSHVHVLLQKLQVNNRTQAALLWRRSAGQGHRSFSTDASPEPPVMPVRAHYGQGMHPEVP
jgi:two-component system NarL family response regulator